MPIKDPEERKAYQREYAKRNSAKAYERVKEWRIANPGARAEEAQKYREKYPTKGLNKALKWISNNPEKAKESQRKSAAKQRELKPEIIKLRKAKYARKNRGVINAAVARRKSAKLQRTPAWLTEEHRWMVKEIYDLAALRTEMLGFQWHVDHIVPLQGELVSGLHVPWNMRVIPAIENIRKKNKFEVEHA